MRADPVKAQVAMSSLYRVLKQATYTCINDLEPEEYHHFGLNFATYTHFTSPIRRYADLLVHRLVTYSLMYSEQTKEKIQELDYSDWAQICSEKA
jgi:exosome complex exonuclease DIS3/RRP44